MAKITLKGNPIKTIGSLPKVGKKAPKFSLIKSDLSKTKLKDFKGSSTETFKLQDAQLKTILFDLTTV